MNTQQDKNQKKNNISARNASEDRNIYFSSLGNNTKSTAKKSHFLAEDFSKNDGLATFSSDNKTLIFADGEKREIYTDDNGDLHLKPTADDLKIFKYVRLSTARNLLWNKYKADEYKLLKQSKETKAKGKVKTQSMFYQYKENGKTIEVLVQKGQEDFHHDYKNFEHLEDYKIIYRYAKEDDLRQNRTCNCLISLSNFSFSKNTEQEETKTEYKANSDKSLSFYESNGECFTVGQFMCSSVWTCPVCSAKISEGRRLEIAKAFETHRTNGGYEYQEVITKKGNIKREATQDTESGIYLFTLTLPHYRKDDLKILMKSIRNAVKLFKESGTYKTALKTLNYIGEIRALEVTWSNKNGWHPHFHSIFFFENILTKKQIDDLKKKLLKLWQACCLKSNLKKPNQRGIDIQDGSHANEYINKWGIEHEVSKWVSKKAGGSSLTPFEILDQYRLTESPIEKLRYKKLFNEYAEAFKGFRQLFWTHGLKAHFGVDDLTDEELANQTQDLEESNFLGSITEEEWEILKKEEYACNIYRVKIPFAFIVSRYVKKHGFKSLKDKIELLKAGNEILDVEDNPFFNNVDKQESEVITNNNGVQKTKIICNKESFGNQSILKGFQKLSKTKYIVQSMFEVNIKNNVKKQMKELEEATKLEVIESPKNKNNFFGKGAFNERVHQKVS